MPDGDAWAEAVPVFPGFGVAQGAEDERGGCGASVGGVDDEGGGAGGDERCGVGFRVGGGCHDGDARSSRTARSSRCEGVVDEIESA